MGLENKHVRKTYKENFVKDKIHRAEGNIFKSTAGTLTALTAVITIFKVEVRPDLLHEFEFDLPRLEHFMNEFTQRLLLVLATSSFITLFGAK